MGYMGNSLGVNPYLANAALRKSLVDDAIRRSLVGR